MDFSYRQDDAVLNGPLPNTGMGYQLGYQAAVVTKTKGPVAPGLATDLQSALKLSYKAAASARAILYSLTGPRPESPCGNAQITSAPTFAGALNELTNSLHETDSLLIDIENALGSM